MTLLKLKSDDKVLCTAQFQPELSAERVSGSVSGAYTDGDESHRDVAHRDHLSTYWMTDTHGKQFLLNFVGIASEAWARMDRGSPVA